MIRFYNTATKQKEQFRSIEPNNVRIYTCGPTVYDYAHIGNFRAYLFEDILHRYLEYKGFKVIQVMNLTDIEDKIIKKSKEQNLSIFEITEPFQKAFFKDIETLNIKRANYYPKATDHIHEIIELIKTLRDKGFTYEKNGSIYYRINKFNNYGNLSGNNQNNIKIINRTDTDEYEKEYISDFVLWKTHKDGEHFWKTELGDGRPGWHIECSAMAMKFLGNHFDIHCGGEDNIFPHHENEIAQSEAATGERYVNYWMHCRHLLVDGEKMSKSKGNFFTLRDLINKNFNPLVIRFFIIMNHYRTPINLTMENINSANSSLSRIINFNIKLREISRKNSSDLNYTTYPDKDCNKLITQFEECMDDDLDTPRAISHLFNFIRETNKIIDSGLITSEKATNILYTLQRIDTVLGVMKEDEQILDEDIERLIQERQNARKNRDFVKADNIRNELKSKQIILEDTLEGVRWKRIP